MEKKTEGVGEVREIEGLHEVGLDRDYVVKLVLVGDSGVGKTSLLKRFTTSRFPTETLTTIGVDFDSKLLKLGGRTVRLSVYDTAGMERFRAVTTSYFRTASAAVLVVDVGALSSVHSLDQWVADIRGA